MFCEVAKELSSLYRRAAGRAKMGLLESTVEAGDDDRRQMRYTPVAGGQNPRMAAVEPACRPCQAGNGSL